MNRDMKPKITRARPGIGWYAWCRQCTADQVVGLPVAWLNRTLHGLAETVRKHVAEKHA